jgi:hypothetical protein
VNINVGAFEMCLGKIQNNDYQNVTRQHCNFSSKIEFYLLCDIKTLLALSCVLNSLIKFAQGRDVFILNLVVTLKICQVDLFFMYIDFMSNYQHKYFQVFSDAVKNIFTTITQD